MYLEGMEEASIFVHVAISDISGKVSGRRPPALGEGPSHVPAPPVGTEYSCQPCPDAVLHGIPHLRPAQLLIQRGPVPVLSVRCVRGPRPRGLTVSVFLVLQWVCVRLPLQASSVWSSQVPRRGRMLGLPLAAVVPAASVPWTGPLSSICEAGPGLPRAGPPSPAGSGHWQLCAWTFF